MPTQIQWLTDFGDQAVVLPIACSVTLFLAASQWWRGAGIWMLAVGGVLGTMLTLKLLFGACGWEVSTALNSPSGHTASTAALYGGLGSILIQRLGVAGTGLIALVIAVLFGMTRVMLGDHTVPEAVVGGTVGVIGAVTLRSLMGHPPTGLKRSGLVVLVLVVAWVAHGRHLPVEQQIHTLSSARLPAVLCPR